MSLPEWYRGMPVETYDVQREFWPFESNPGDYNYQPKGDLCLQLQEILGKIYRCKFAFGEIDDPLLPALPGLAVLGGIAIPTPLSDKHARRFTDRTIASTTGVNRWTLPGQQVMMKNPQWDERMTELGALLGGQMGLDGVFIVKLEELVVYGPGGRLDRTKDPDPDHEKRGVTAKIVVQLPTLHTGGDFVVFDDEDVGRTYRFDFGEGKGTAAFRPSYTVFVAGAEYEVEEVKSGYCVRLVYSVCPPKGEKKPMGMRAMRSLYQTELSEVVRGLAQSNETFALLLSNQFDKYRDFENRGCDVLTGGDRSWFHALESANDQLPLAWRVKLNVVELENTTQLERNVHGDALRMWKFKNASESAMWFSTGGKLLCDSPTWTQRLNFLNPTEIWPRTLWNKHMRRDGEFDEQTIQYRAFAIVGWSLALDVRHSIDIMGENGALMAMLAEDPIRAFKLKEFMGMARGTEVDASEEKPISPYLYFCQNLCKAIALSADKELMKLFFAKFFDRLKRKEQLVPSLVELGRVFGWETTTTPSLQAIERLDPVDGMALALAVAASFDDGSRLRDTATLLAVKQAVNVPVKMLASSKHVGLLWSCAVSCPETCALRALVKIFKQMDGSLLGPATEAISQCISAVSSSEDHLELVQLISTRMRWLESEISRLRELFTWRMPDAKFPGSAEVEAFLQGPEPIRVVRGFGDTAAAHSFIDRNHSALFTTRMHGTGDNTVVIMTKSSKKLEDPAELEKRQAELKKLSLIPTTSPARIA